MCAYCKLLSINVFISFPFAFKGRIWDLIVSVPDHCLSFYFWNKVWLWFIVSFTRWRIWWLTKSYSFTDDASMFYLLLTHSNFCLFIFIYLFYLIFFLFFYVLISTDIRYDRFVTGKQHTLNWDMYKYQIKTVISLV